MIYLDVNKQQAMYDWLMYLEVKGQEARYDCCN